MKRSLAALLGLALASCTLLAAAFPGTAATPASAPTSAPAKDENPLTITLADDGKTFTVAMGREIRVMLGGKRAHTGWEEAVAPKGAVMSEGQSFVPADDVSDRAIGCYVFQYKAVKVGEVKLEFQYITPGGPGVTERLRSARIAQFAVTIIVKEGGVTSTSRPAVAASKPALLVEFHQQGGFAGQDERLTIDADGVAKVSGKIFGHRTATLGVDKMGALTEAIETAKITASKDYGPSKVKDGLKYEITCGKHKVVWEDADGAPSGVQLLTHKLQEIIADMPKDSGSDQ